MASNFWFVQLGYSAGFVETAETMKPNAWVKEVVPIRSQGTCRVTYRTMKIDPSAEHPPEKCQIGDRRHEVGRQNEICQESRETQKGVTFSLSLCHFRVD